MNPIMKWLEPYLSLVKIVAIAVAIAAAVWWWNSFVDRQRQIGYDKAAGEYRQQLAEQKEAALERERGLNAQLKGAIDERTETEKHLAAARGAAAEARHADRARAGRSADFDQRGLNNEPSRHYPGAVSYRSRRAGCYCYLRLRLGQWRGERAGALGQGYDGAVAGCARRRTGGQGKRTIHATETERGPECRD